MYTSTSTYTTTTTQTTATQCLLLKCKCSICTSGWMKKHHQRKLQMVNHHVHKCSICASGCRKSTTIASCNWWQPPPVQVEWLHQLKEGKRHKRKVQRSGCKVQRSRPASVLVVTGWARFEEEMVGPHAICTDCCIVLCWSYLVGGDGCRCMLCFIPYQLALMLAFTFAPSFLTVAPCILTIAPCICDVSLLSTGENWLLSFAQVVVVTSCNLQWWRLSCSH